MQDSMKASNSNSFTVEMMSSNDNGDRKYNWNLPFIEGKYQEVYNSFTSKQALKQKVFGEKYTLISPNSIPILRDSNGKIVRRSDYNKLTDLQRKQRAITGSRLQYAIKDPKTGQYYTECVVSQKFGQEYNLKPGDDIPLELSEVLGTRIPADDKHSMVYLRIVDFIPPYYGNSIAYAGEIYNP
jgi:hypothetical protein